MKKKVQYVLITIILVLMTVSVSLSQGSRGKVMEGLTIDSKILGKKMRYSVYLPFDYETSQRYYPVVYLLHGYTDNDMGWIQFGEAHIKADKAIAEGTIPPMIIVMPDAGVSWYINNHDNSVAYEDYFFEEFMTYIESKYRIRKEKRYRGVAGLSMGGYGTLVYSLKHPDKFAACAAFSAAIINPVDAPQMDQERWNNVFGVVYGKGLAGEERLTEHFKKNNPFYMVESTNNDNLKSVRYYLDCGDDDYLSKVNNDFHNLLFEEQISHEYRVRDGKHHWPYWRSGLIDGLKFIGESFHQF